MKNFQKIRKGSVNSSFAINSLDNQPSIIHEINIFFMHRQNILYHFSHHSAIFLVFSSNDDKGSQVEGVVEELSFSLRNVDVPCIKVSLNVNEKWIFWKRIDNLIIHNWHNLSN